ncbi:MAG: restriction endonuclease [Candidatus Levybacteria bacterium]|nr:restriction endonuclease [Candidatus Levybacteria bacterium]
MVNVIKSTGEKEQFNEGKLRTSIIRAGIPKEIENQVISHIETKLYDNIPTSEIYRHIKEFLGSSSRPYSAAKYALKQGIMELGPTGYPFEDFVAKVLNKEGYETEVRSILQGKCVSHEIDIIAKKDNKKFMIEAKFHNDLGTKSDVHVSLYTKARFDDVSEKYNFYQAWLITNTKVTTDALAYALCVNMKVISWNYPEQESLRDLIEKSGLHPITVLTTLSQNEKQKLLDSHLVLSRDICQNPNVLSDLHLPKDKLEKVLAESNFVCSLG